MVRIGEAASSFSTGRFRRSGYGGVVGAEQSDQPIMSNFATVAVAQGIAYLDFGFIEPALLAKVMVDQQNGKSLPGQVEGKLVAFGSA